MMHAENNKAAVYLNGKVSDAEHYWNGAHKAACSSSVTTTTPGAVAAAKCCQPLLHHSNSYETLAERMTKRIQQEQRWFSCEFFPPRTANGAANLVTRFERFAKGNPLFCDVTWHPAGKPESDTPTSSMTIANSMLNYCGIETMLHITCWGYSPSDMKGILQKAVELGIRNIMALRGDLPQKASTRPANAFQYAADFVRFIRQEFGNYFVICVAGYPTGHPDAASYTEDLLHLKEKVDAGADFIITQLFFDAKDFLRFERDCRNLGIGCPIIPGVMPIQAYQSLNHIVKLSKLKVPEDIWRQVEKCRENDDAIRQFGVQHCAQLCRDLFHSGTVQGIHFYTLNREIATIEVLRQVGLWQEAMPRNLPWKTTANYERAQESTRPIFWSLRPNAYVYRTSHWEEYPNGRWGNSSAASFGELEDYYLFYLKPKVDTAELQLMWGREIHTEEDVWRVFVNYLSGSVNENGVKVTCLPWHDDEIQAETLNIQNELINLNSRGALTINSQPNVNGIDSEDGTFGWGGAGGFIYQKAYLEFFIHEKHVTKLRNEIEKWSPRVNYHIVNARGDEWTNCDAYQPIAVTWGVFPGKEVLQPTVVDPVAFKHWRDEAFMLWYKQWAILYEEKSESYKVIQHIHDHYCLVNLVDNHFPKNSCLWTILNTVLLKPDRVAISASNGH